MMYIHYFNWFSDFTINSSLVYKEGKGEFIIKTKSENQFVKGIKTTKQLLYEPFLCV